MDGLEAIPIVIAELFCALFELLVLAAELLILGVELLVWGFYLLLGRKRERPGLRTHHLKYRRKNLFAKLVAYGGMVLIFAGFLAHESFFRADIRFSSNSPIPAWNVEYELHSDSGRIRSCEGSESYLTYRWDSLVVTDVRYEPLEVKLTKKDQTVALKSRRLEKAVEELKDKANKKSSKLFQGLKEKANSFKEDAREKEPESD